MIADLIANGHSKTFCPRCHLVLFAGIARRAEHLAV
ncbi:hypothetical protein KRX11_05380 [Pasteurellaceae bacterium TAE3-ERU1]|nr:hypothetical protein [Pasteurellaceae bacterium TAE3-ERU1]